MESLGHEIVWTPPYCPKLQPIELFWAAGKNHVALQHKYDMKMLDVVQALRVGWYGNGCEFADNHPKHKRAVNCHKLWATCLRYAGTIYIPICDGISGDIGSLVVDQNHTDDPYVLPIDTLVLDLTKNDDLNVENGYFENV